MNQAIGDESDEIDFITGLSASGGKSLTLESMLETFINEVLIS